MDVKCVQMPEPFKLELVNKKLILADDEVLVETFQSSICDADLRAWQGKYIPEDLPPTCFPWPGHEGGGTVLEVGNKVKDFKVGDKVMLFGPNNSMADYFKAPEQLLYKAPEGLDMEIASLGEPICVGMLGVFESGVQLGDVVVVAGLNFQGMIGVQGLKKCGAEKLIAIDYSDSHLELAKDLGADIIINTKKENAKDVVLELTKGKGVDVCLHSCGYWNPHQEEYYNLCIDITKDRGIVASVPDMMSPITVNLHRFHHHSMDVRFPAVMHRGVEFRKQWTDRLMNPIVKGMIDIKPLITGKYPLSKVQEAMKDFNDNLDHIKIVITPDK